MFFRLQSGIMETICLKIKIREENLNDIRNWFATLNNRAEEVLQTLEAEGIIIESVFLDKQDTDYYLIYYIKAKNLAYAREVADKSNFPIDKFHRDCFKKFCNERYTLEPLANFQNFIVSDMTTDF